MRGRVGEGERGRVGEGEGEGVRVRGGGCLHHSEAPSRPQAPQWTWWYRSSG